MNHKNKYIAASLLSLIGLGLAIYLAVHFYGIRSGAAGFSSICDVGRGLNCSAVAASPYAEVFPGIPLASVTAGWYLAMALVALMGLANAWRREGVRAFFAMSAVGLAASLVYLVIMTKMIGALCLFCLLIDVVNVLLFGLALWLKPQKFSTHPADVSEWKTIAGITAVSLLVTVVGLKGLDEVGMDRTMVAEAAQSVLNSPVLAVNAGDEFPSFGPKDARVTIVEFSDFQCPYCRLGALTLNTLLNRYHGKLRVVFRNWPLDMSCNPAIKQPMHNAACETARAATCAFKQGKFEPFYEHAFENQVHNGPGRSLEFARQLNLDMGQLESCMKSSETELALAKDLQEGERLGVKSTPTFFINGHKVEGAFQLQVWNAMIDQLLAQP